MVWTDDLFYRVLSEFLCLFSALYFVQFLKINLRMLAQYGFSLHLIKIGLSERGRLYEQFTWERL